MKRLSLRVLAALGLLMSLTDGLFAQGVVVEVRSLLGGAPIVGARVTAVWSGRLVHTDRLGRARLPSIEVGGRLVVSALGFLPDTVTADPGLPLQILRLVPVPVTLGDISADRYPNGAPAAAWTIPRSLVHSLPTAVESDPVRALQAVPSVSFSTPLSARPIVRGYDASMSTVRLDGYELLNPYHLGRIFSGFPGDAIESITVTPGPPDPATSGTLGGTVDVAVRRADEALEGGIGVALTSWTGWAGTNSTIPTFAAGRWATIEGASELVGGSVPYSFADGLARSTIPLGRGPAAELTLFLSRDRLGEASDGLSMRWSNALIGNRIRLQDSPEGSLDLTASWNRYRLAGHQVPSRDRDVDLANRFDRASVALEAGRKLGGGTLLRFGAGVAWRRAATLLIPAGQADRPFDRDDGFLEGSAFADVVGRVGTVDLSLGGRVDGNDAGVVFSPTMALHRRFGTRTVATLRAGRSARLYQQITDPLAEPDLAFFDLWVTAGRDGVPTPRVDHLSLEVDRKAGNILLSGAAFLSSGSGAGELRPVVDRLRDDPTGIRFGRSRTRGLEFRAGRPAGAPGGAGAALTYVLSWSERKWEDGRWRPWILDRRHLFRFQAEVPVGRGWRFGSVGEFQSGQPLTPVVEIVTVDGLGPVFRFGEEGSGRGGATIRFDLALRKRVAGPWSTRLDLGLSVINAGFGPTAPSTPKPPASLASPFPNGVEYERLFSLPAIPSFTLRWLF